MLKNEKYGRQMKKICVFPSEPRLDGTGVTMYDSLAQLCKYFDLQVTPRAVEGWLRSSGVPRLGGTKSRGVSTVGKT
jgi:hypothetical protein